MNIQFVRNGLRNYPILILLVFATASWSYAHLLNEKRTQLPDGHIKVQTYDSAGLLKEEELFINVDSGLTRDGYSKTFFPNGQINTLNFFKNGIVDSAFLIYYEDGKLCALGHIRDGRLNGMFYSFYRNGDTLQKEHYMHDELMGSQYRFDSGTHKIYQYVFTQHTKSYKLLIEYNEQGNIIKRKGKSLMIELDDEKKVYDKRDTAGVILVLARPPKAKASVVLYKNNLSNVIYKYTYADFHYLKFADFNTVNLQYPCSKGSIKIIAVSELTDSLTNKRIIKDTSYLNIRVE